jgi:hypothetical protein
VDDSKKRVSVPPTGIPDSPARNGYFYFREFLKKLLNDRRLPLDSDVIQAVAFWFTENGHIFLLRRLIAYPDGQEVEIEFRQIGEIFKKIALFTSTKSHFRLGRKASNEFAETSNTLKHRFLDGAQIIFHFYKRQNML